MGIPKDIFNTEAENTSTGNYLDNYKKNIIFNLKNTNLKRIREVNVLKNKDLKVERLENADVTSRVNVFLVDSRKGSR